jgi:hypothetical protein
MINLEEVLEMWKKDSVIDDMNLDDASKNAAKLHAKYLEFVSVTKLMLKKRCAEQETLKKDKWLWYMGKMPKEDMDKRGWPYDPFNGLKIMKSDIDYYEKADPELQKIDATVLYLKTTLEALIEIMETLKWRHSTIRNILEWKKFTSGV